MVCGGHKIPHGKVWGMSQFGTHHGSFSSLGTVIAGLDVIGREHLPLYFRFLSSFGKSHHWAHQVLKRAKADPPTMQGSARLFSALEGLS